MNYNKKVVFDIDGVISNIQSTITVMNQETGKNLNMEDINQYNLAKVYGITCKELSNIFINKMGTIIGTEVLSNNIFILFNYFKNYYCGGNNRILIMTARNKEYGKFTLNKFFEHGIINGVHYDELHLGCFPKEYFLEKEKPDAVIEDRIKTLISLKEDFGYSCDMFLMDRPYNKEYKDYIYRITEENTLHDLIKAESTMFK